MNTNQSERLKDLFAEAIDLPEEQRDAFLASLGKSEPGLASELASLIDAHRNTGKFLEPPGFLSAQKEERVGEHIGPYRVLRQVARGGMGEVYEAVRDDGVFDKRVALKLVRYGMSRAELVERFQRERQTLARLEHPNIARLLDGGTTPDGIPYLVMEFVDGKRIDEYCDERRLSIEERLRLFSTVCSAIQYAHQRLVVHRDLKPNNILVTPEGQPKLLDFGIAKLLVDDTATHGEDLTRTGINIFTPEYASPEQVRGEEITTASDVYSLGVLLYKLLTGHKPYEFKSPLAHDIAQTVLESEATKPSSKSPTIKSTLSEERIKRALAGDLDNILLMALRKEQERRYASVEQFAEDIERYLNGLPVSARPNTLSYRTTKFVRRNRISVFAVGLIGLTLLGGLATTLYQMRAANTEKARAESINTFLKQMLSYSNPIRSTPGKNGGEATMKDMLDEAVRHLASPELSNQMEVKAELERIIAECYGGQGRYDLMNQHLQTYVAIQEQLYGENDPKSLDALAIWASILFSRGEVVKSEQVYRTTLPRMRKALNDGTIKADVLASALNNFAYLRRTQGDSREAEQAFREVLTLTPLLPAESRFLVGTTRSTLASTLADQGRFSDALQTAREAVTECIQLNTTTTPDFGFALTILGGFLTDQRQFVEADSVLSEAEKMFRRLLLPSHLWLGDNLRNQAASLYQQGRYVEAQAKVTEALKIYRESFGPHYDHYPTALTIQGLVLNRTGQPAQGEILLREALKLRQESMPVGHYFTALAQSALGECLTTEKRYAEAEPLLLGSFESLSRSQGPTNPRTLLAKDRLAALYQAMDKSKEALKYRD